MPARKVGRSLSAAGAAVFFLLADFFGMSFLLFDLRFELELSLAEKEQSKARRKTADQDRQLFKRRAT